MAKVKKYRLYRPEKVQNCGAIFKMVFISGKILAVKNYQGRANKKRRKKKRKKRRKNGDHFANKNWA